MAASYFLARLDRILPSCRAVGDEFGMLSPKRFRHVARPTNRFISFKDLGQLFRRHVIPAYRLGIRSLQGRDVAGPFRHAIHRFVTVRAGLALVPARHDVAYQAPATLRFHLSQAILGATLPLRPTRTILKTKVISAAKCL